MMAVLGQSGADFRQGQIVPLCDQRMNTFRLRLNPVRQTIPAAVAGSRTAGRGGKSAPENRTCRADAKPFSCLTTRQTIRNDRDNTFAEIQSQCA
ncbi:hypothetical protein AA0535_2176 [Asaia krungthepensis NRIC 0535]|uniref:Uncharacterized protein n=1 Tax=Asaia krungthepensis NRIC 0535 TaxID=1307925 RepID=A0ABQ0Q4H3_9PROT|nr:hypothetical protein AA0535_2176 [Asaia krungthepensis NRIC 0535]